MGTDKLEDFRGVLLTEYDMVIIKQCLGMVVYDTGKALPVSKERVKMLLDFFEAELNT